MKWYRDPKVEDVLNRFGLKWEVVEVKVANIEAKARLTNRGRIKVAVDDDYVDKMAYQMIDGSWNGPMIVVKGTDRKEYYDPPVGGNHRYGSMKIAGVEQAPMYVVRYDDTVIDDLLPPALNQMEGRGADIKEINALAVRMIECSNLSPAEVARLLGADPQKVKTALGVHKARKTLSEAGVNTATLTKAAIVKLARIRPQSSMAEAAELAIDHEMKGDDIAKLVKGLKDAKSDIAIREVLDTAKVAMVADGMGTGLHSRTPQKTKWKSALKGMETVLEESSTWTAMQIRLTKDQREYCTRVQIVIGRLQQLVQDSPK